MLRALVVIFLISNLIFFGWLQGWFGESPELQGREPERLESQVRPNAIQSLATSSSDEHTSTTANGHETPFTPPIPSIDPPMFFCLEAGPLNGQQSSQLQNIVTDILPLELWEMDVYAVASSWAIYLGPFKSEEEATIKLRELNNQGTRAAIVRGKPQHQPGLTLDLFRELPNAEKRLNEVHAKGISEARIEPWTLHTSGQMLRVTEASEEQKERLEQLALENNLPAFEVCAKDY